MKNCNGIRLVEREIVNDRHQQMYISLHCLQDNNFFSLLSTTIVSSTAQDDMHER